MMILSGPEIRRLATSPLTDCGRRISITPFTESRLNPNSYNLRLSPDLVCYAPHYAVLDMSVKHDTYDIKIPASGLVLYPGVLYLGATIERIEAHGIVPCIEGRSSVGRLGLSVHTTAGVGDDGFAGQFVLELSVVQPLRVYAGIEVCQVMFFDLLGDRQPYVGKYQNQEGPIASRLWRDFVKRNEGAATLDRALTGQVG